MKWRLGIQCLVCLLLCVCCSGGGCGGYGGLDDRGIDAGLCWSVKVDALGDILHGPIKASDEVEASVGTTGLDLPSVGGGEVMLIQAEGRANLVDAHGTCEVLFVGKYEHCGASETLLSEESVEFGAAVVDTSSVARVDYPDETVGALKVVLPVRAERPLSADIPDVECIPGMGEGVDAEPERGGDGLD